jgi:hypothetical protein
VALSGDVQRRGAVLCYKRRLTTMRRYFSSYRKVNIQ